MGIQNLLPLLKPVIKDTHISQYKGKTVAIDGYCWLHRAVYGCCVEICKGVETDLWIRYFINYVELLLQNLVKVVVVFDGDALPAKQKTEEDRGATRSNNLLKAQQFERSGDMNSARMYYSRATDVTPKMAARIIQILKEIHPDVQCIVAPYEADAQLSYLSINNFVDAVVSEDSDTIPYGCKDIIFKLDRGGNCQRLILSDLFEKNIPSFDLKQFTQEMIIIMCIVSGCDYLQSIKGVGLKSSYKIISKQRTIASTLKNMRLTGLIPLEYVKNSNFSQNIHNNIATEGSQDTPENDSSINVYNSFTQSDVTTASNNTTIESIDNDTHIDNYNSANSCTNTSPRIDTLNTTGTLLVYELEFYKAYLTFLHQTVYDPKLKRAVHRTPIIYKNLPICIQQRYPCNNNSKDSGSSSIEVDLPFLGSMIHDHDLMQNIAEGRVDPCSKVQFDFPAKNAISASIHNNNVQNNNNNISKNGNNITRVNTTSYSYTNTSKVNSNNYLFKKSLTSDDNNKIHRDVNIYKVKYGNDSSVSNDAKKNNDGVLAFISASKPSTVTSTTAASVTIKSTLSSYSAKNSSTNNIASSSIVSKIKQSSSISRTLSVHANKRKLPNTIGNYFGRVNTVANNNSDNSNNSDLITPSAQQQQQNQFEYNDFDSSFSIDDEDKEASNKKQNIGLNKDNSSNQHNLIVTSRRPEDEKENIIVKQYPTSIVLSPKRNDNRNNNEEITIYNLVDSPLLATNKPSNNHNNDINDTDAVRSNGNQEISLTRSSCKESQSWRDVTKLLTTSKYFSKSGSNVSLSSQESINNLNSFKTSQAKQFLVVSHTQKNKSSSLMTINNKADNNDENYCGNSFNYDVSLSPPVNKNKEKLLRNPFGDFSCIN